MPPKAAAPKAEGKAKAKAAAAKAKAKTEEEEDKNRVAQPDRAAFDEAVAKIQEVIDGFQKEQQGLATKIAERSGGKEEFFAKKAELRSQLDEFSAKIGALMERKDEINKAMGDKRQEGQEMRQQLNKMKKSIGYTSEAEIDDRIATIEFKLCTDTISLKEEKEFLKEIAELKKNRPKVTQVNQMESNIQNRDVGAGLKENIASINEEMAQYRDGKKQVQAKLSELMEGRKEQLGDLPQIIEQREAIGKKIAEKVKERNELRDEFRQKEREFREYMNEVRQARQAKIQEERAARQAEWNKEKLKRAAEKLDEQPYVAEMTLIEQTISFCKSLSQPKESEAKEEKKDIAHNNPEGTEVLAKKEDREEFFFVPTAKKKGKKSKGSSAAAGSSKPIKHNAETFRLFDQLKLDAPITTDDIPALLEKLEEQLESYKGKVKEWEEKREEMKRKILEDGVFPGEEKPEGAAEGEEKKDDE